MSTTVHYLEGLFCLTKINLLYSSCQLINILSCQLTWLPVYDLILISAVAIVVFVLLVGMAESGPFFAWFTLVAAAVATISLYNNIWSPRTSSPIDLLKECSAISDNYG